MDSRSEYWRWSRPPLGKKLQVLCNNSRPCYQHCWLTRLKALAVNGGRTSGWRGSYTSLIGYPCRFKVPQMGCAFLQWTLQSKCNSSSFSHCMVPTWIGSRISGWTVHSIVRQIILLPSLISRQQTTRHTSCQTVNLRTSCFCNCWSKNLEQFTWLSKRFGTLLRHL